MKRPALEVPSRMHQRRTPKPQVNGHELKPFNTIYEIAAFSNLKVRTLRKYKQKGLLKPSTKVRANADMFSEAEVLRFLGWLMQQAEPEFAADQKLVARRVSPDDKTPAVPCPGTPEYKEWLDRLPSGLSAKKSVILDLDD